MPTLPTSSCRFTAPGDDIEECLFNFTEPPRPVTFTIGVFGGEGMRCPIGIGLVLCLAAGSAAAPNLKDPPPKGPEIAGDWVLTSLSMGGVPTPVGDIAVHTEFTADGRRVSRNRLGQVIAEAQYALGRDQSPPTFDLRAKPDGPVTSRGIYAVDGDILTIWYTIDPDAARPAKLEAPAGSKVWLVVYTRAKKKD